MLSVQDPVSGAKTLIAVAGGDTLHMGFVIPDEAGPYTCARVLAAGDLLRRVVEDIHSAQVLAAIVSNDNWVIEQDWESALSVRPVIGRFRAADEAETTFGHSLDFVVMVAEEHEQPASGPPAMVVAPAHAMVPYPGAEPNTARFALTNTNYRYRLDITSSLLEHSHQMLERWRDRVAHWSRHPGRPSPPAWRQAVVSAFDCNLNVARVAALMGELEDADSVEAGAKFEAFTYVDRMLAIDLGRHLGRPQSQRTDSG